MMATRECVMNVPAEKLAQFHALVCATKGSYRSVPIFNEDGTITVHFDYAYESDFMKIWSDKVLAPTKRPGFFTRLTRYFFV